MSNLSPAAIQALEEGAAKSGLSDRIPILLKHAREAILVETRVAGISLRPGQSRIAGQPDLPPDFARPKDAEGNDLKFCCQINLSELPACVAKTKLPAEGHLFFFCSEDFEMQAVHHLENNFVSAEQTLSLPPPPPEKAGFWKTLFTTKRSESPEWRLCEVNFHPIPSLPQWNQPEYTALKQELDLEEDDESLNEFESAVSRQFGGEYPTKLFGFPDQIQSTNLGLEAQIQFEKLISSKNSSTDPAFATQRQAASDWILLFQLASDKNANMMWADAGCIYCLIRKQDLEQGRFDAIQSIWECG